MFRLCDFININILLILRIISFIDGIYKVCMKFKICVFAYIIYSQMLNTITIM